MYNYPSLLMDGMPQVSAYHIQAYNKLLHTNNSEISGYSLVKQPTGTNSEVLHNPYFVSDPSISYPATADISSMPVSTMNIQPREICSYQRSNTSTKTTDSMQYPISRTGEMSNPVNMFSFPHTPSNFHSQQANFTMPSTVMMSSPHYQPSLIYQPITHTLPNRMLTMANMSRLSNMPNMPSLSNLCSLPSLPSMPSIPSLPVTYINMPDFSPQKQTMNLIYNSTIGGKSDLEDLLKTSKRKINLEEMGIKPELKKAKVETRALKAKRPGFTDERYNETTYYRENGLRKVHPYYFTFTTFTKGRWVGESILEVFSREFRAHPQQEYARCINAGTLTVNYEKVETDYKLRHNDLLANIVHRHEVPVTAEEIKIITMTDDLVVVNKPASIPVHPCGRYRHNTVVFILAKDYGFKNLRTIHRLDRLTSGLLMFGRSPAKAREMETQIRTRQVRKEYICRVEGEFPMGLIQCREPIEVVSYKIGVCKVARSGKDCWTDFQRLSFNGETSVVLCRPHTGRMHQIRVHLQYLGHPVINDPLYNHPVFGPNKGKGGDIGKTDDELVNELIEIHNSENWLGENDPDLTSPVQNLTTPCQDNSQPDKTVQNLTTSCQDNSQPDKTVQNLTTPCQDNSQPEKTGQCCGSPDSGVSLELQTLKEMKHTPELPSSTQMPDTPESLPDTKEKCDPNCYECTVKYRDPAPSDLVMFLHALKYQGHNWSYETELPYWAEPDWKEV